MSWRCETCDNGYCNEIKINKKSGFCKNHYGVYKDLIYSGMDHNQASMCVGNDVSHNYTGAPCRLSKWSEDEAIKGWNPRNYCNHKMGRGLGLCNKHLLMCSRHCHDSNTNILEFIDTKESEVNKSVLEAGSAFAEKMDRKLREGAAAARSANRRSSNRRLEERERMEERERVYNGLIAPRAVAATDYTPVDCVARRLCEAQQRDNTTDNTPPPTTSNTINHDSSTGTPGSSNPPQAATAAGLAAMRRAFQYSGGVEDSSTQLVKMTMQLQGVGTEAYTLADSLLQNTWIKRDKYSFLQLDEVKLIINPILQKRYDEYKASMPTDVLNGNEQAFFHGCSEGVVDSIAENGFKKEFWRTSSGDWQRFGPGFYFAPQSSKSHEYPLDQMSALSQGEHTRTMLLCKVIKGVVFETKHNMSHLSGAAPSGYNSIHGLASSNGPLNYDEIVVFDEAAIIPYATVNYRFIKCSDPGNPVVPTLPQGSDNDWSEMIQGERLNVVDNGMGLCYNSLEEAITAALNTPRSVGIWGRTDPSDTRRMSFHVLRSGNVREWGIGVPNDTVHRVWRRVDRSPKKAPGPSNICSICQDECDSNPLPCGHHFHQECLLKWTQTGRSLGNSCPNCRKPFDISYSFKSRGEASGGTEAWIGDGVYLSTSKYSYGTICEIVTQGDSTVKIYNSMTGNLDGTGTFVGEVLTAEIFGGTYSATPKQGALLWSDGEEWTSHRPWRDNLPEGWPPIQFIAPGSFLRR
jgi:hypothetical protein